MGAIRLSATAFLVLTERLGVRVPSAVWLVPDGLGPDRINDASAELSRLELVDEWGDVDESLAGRLRLFDQATRIVDVVAHVDGPANAVLVATERRAVLVINRGQQVLIRRATAQSLSDQAVRLLPDTSPGYGRSVSLPTETLRKAAAEAGDDTRELQAALQRLGVGSSDARMIAVMNESPVDTAQFGVTVKRRRGQRVIGWWRTESGGYLTEEHISPSGEPWTTIAPTDAARLARQIDRVLFE
ncbi:ESX secretion-associated protein EspG [Kibdelosporangium persicum]|uniref:ESX secretion-associated protein EspG n=1 Tax=Kibdelosporangium persicum TaxID=2698649 RepID=A0ABX2FBV4_9PSEU|nr:ESX secretion-associated protein EspG [Kibdelosporangium persicum]NRN68390.1 ESX secretion-associated protein EspG [Kibdelosporangium persicum]